MPSVQNAITDFNVVKIEYHAAQRNEITQRDIAPFAIINKVGESWHLIAWCRARKDFRLFRFDRIKKTANLRRQIYSSQNQPSEVSGK